MDRRQLDLTTLDAVIDEVKRLQTQGYEKVGDWDLSQICEHVCLPIDMAIDGSPFKVNIFLRTIASLFAKKKLFRERKIKAGLPAPGSAVFESTDETEAIAKLEEAVGRFRAHQGPWQKHPFFGNLTAQQWLEFNTIHCSHHLAYLIPKSS